MSYFIAKSGRAVPASQGAGGPGASARSNAMRRVMTAAAVIVLSLAGCANYTFTGRLPEHIKTVYIPTFENRTPEYYLDQLITDQVTERFLSEANLGLGDEQSADAALRGTVSRYYEEAETYGREGGLDVSGRRVTIVLDIEFLDRVENTTLWQDRNFSRYVIYDPDKESERDAAERVVELLSDDLISGILQQW